ncbi:ATP-binding protein [Granulicella rosea]|nr:ATP-binding protein [Granulicella rosea]
MQLNPATIRLQPALDDLVRLVDAVESFAAEHGLRPADAHALTLAAEELFANTVKHSQPPAGYVEFTLGLADGVVTAVYIDDGAPFDPTARAAPDTTLPAELRPIGGLGIYFIQRTMQSFAYERLDGRNVLRFTRKLA